MNSFKIAEDLYHEAKYVEAHPFFKKSLIETPNNQLIFSYITTTSIIAKDFDNIDYYLTFHFKNYLITDIIALEEEFQLKEFGEYLSSEIIENKVQLSPLAKLIFEYFEADYEDRLTLLNDFVPKTPLEEYWQCAFLLNIYTSRDRKEATIKLEKCLNINSECALPYFLRHFSQHELENSVEYLDKALEIKPDYIEVLEEKARLYFEDDYYESYPKAIKVCDQIMFFNPSKKLLTWSLWVKGYSFVQLGKFAEGIICYNQSMQIDSEQNLYLDRGSAKNRMKDYTGALTDYLKYIQLKTTDINPIILTAIGTIYLNLKKYNEAIKYYTDSIEKQSNSSLVYFRRASAFQAINQKMLAEADIRTANQIITVKKESYSSHGNISQDEL